MKDHKHKSLNVEDFSRYCGVSLKTVMRWIKNGEINVESHTRGHDYKINIDNLSRIKFENNSHIYSNQDYTATNKSKVLIVDDDENILNYIGPVFRKNGFETFFSTNAYEAMILLHDEQPLIITLDLNLSDTSGLEVIKMINDLGVNQNIWIIVVSAGSESELQSAVNYGADFYLAKPIQRKDLDKIINKIASEAIKKSA